MNRIGFALLLFSTLSTGLLAASPAQAASSFSSQGQTCPDYYGCIYGNGWSQGWNISANDTTWYPVFGVGGGNGWYVRNRNHTSKRAVVVRYDNGGCAALRYDNRGWVWTGASNATAMRLTSATSGNLSGCSWTNWL